MKPVGIGFPCIAPKEPFNHLPYDLTSKGATGYVSEYGKMYLTRCCLEEIVERTINHETLHQVIVKMESLEASIRLHWIEECNTTHTFELQENGDVKLLQSTGGL